jgi:hypothetical protein
MRTLTAALALVTPIMTAVVSVSAQNPVPSPTTPPGPTIAPGPTIKEGSRVRLEYTLTDTAGTVLDTNKGAEPFAYTHGDRQIVPGLE